MLSFLKNLSSSHRDKRLAGSFFNRHIVSRRRRPPIACKHMISGSLSLPSRGAFHLSLTVLVHYRSLGVFSLTAWSRLLPTRFHVSRGIQDWKTESSPSSRCTTRRLASFVYGAFTFFGGPFQALQLDRLIFLKLLSRCNIGTVVSYNRTGYRIPDFGYQTTLF